eukprot:s3853_g6.t5
MLPLPCPCVEWLWNRREALPAQPRANGDGRRKATTVSIAPEDVPEEQVPAEGDMHSAPARRPTRDYSKLTSFVRDDTDELDGTDTWRYYALVAEKEVENSTRKLVEAQQAEGSEAAPQPSLTPTRRSVVRRPQLLQNSMLQYLSHTVCDAIEQGIICKEDFPRAILEDKHSKYNASKGRFEAVVVFMDASGFTALTESLARQAHGAEEIGSCLNNFFGALIEIITRHGGDVLKFSGDALTILWRVEDEGVPWRSRSPSKSTNSSCTLPPLSKADARFSAAANACRCCVEGQSRVSSFGATPVPGVVLTLHIGVGFGPLTLLQLGGVLDRWEFCAAGQPLEEVAIAEPLAHSGETVVSPSVQEVLASKGQNSEFCFEAGFLEQPGYALLTSTAAPLGSGQEHPRSPARRTLDASVVQRYVPQAAKRNLSQTSVEALILGLQPEMRRVSVIFLSIRGLNPGSLAPTGDDLRTQQVVKLLQQSCYAFEGSVNKFLVDDKGMLLLCAFGLPPLNHYIDDPLRAVLTAARFCDSLAEEGLQGRAGVATGTVWCGTVGSQIRREYTVLGDTVNLSARLMAKTDINTVLVDAATFSSCKRTLAFESLGEISVKGKQEQIQVYRFTGDLLPRRDRDRKGLQRSLLSWEEWPAREELMAALEAQLQHQPGPGGLVFVHGGPGCGKTDLAAHVRAWALEQELCVLAGQNQSPTGTLAVPRLCWQEVFAEMLKVARSDPAWNDTGEHVTDREIIRRMLLSAGATRELLAWLPVLRLVFPALYFGPNVVNAMVERDALHAKTRPLKVVTLCKMLVDAFTTHSTKSQGTVILLHLRRSTSFFGETTVEGLMNLCMERRETGKKPVMLCVVTRETILQSQAFFLNSRNLNGEVQASNLSRDMTEKYVMHITGAAAGVAPDLLQYVFESSGGNPFGVEVVLQELRQGGAVQVSEEGFLELSDGDEADLSQLAYPESLIGIALASWEKLLPHQQDLVKNVAMCSQEADCEVLNILDLAETLELEEEQLREACSNLVMQGFFRPQMPLPKRMTRRALPDGPSPAGGGRASTTPSSGRSPVSTRAGVKAPSDMELAAISFSSQLLRHVVLSLVLHSQKEIIRHKLPDEEKEDKPARPPRPRLSEPESLVQVQLVKKQLGCSSKEALSLIMRKQQRLKNGGQDPMPAELGSIFQPSLATQTRRVKWHLAVENVPTASGEVNRKTEWEDEATKDLADARCSILAVQEEKASLLALTKQSGLREYTFDRVFGERAAQADIFAGSARRLVMEFLNGTSASIICYGQTASGKTHTMFGPPQKGLATTSPELQGLVPRTCAEVLRTVEIWRQRGIEVHLSASYVELFGSEVSDLLRDGQD